MEGTPTVLDYKVQAEADSMSNTPASYAWYVAGLVFQWLKSRAGLGEMEEKHREVETALRLPRRQRLLQKPGEEIRPLAHEHPVTLADSKLDGEFLKGAEARGMVQLKGHAPSAHAREYLQAHADRMA